MKHLTFTLFALFFLFACTIFGYGIHSNNEFLLIVAFILLFISAICLMMFISLSWDEYEI